MADKRTSTITRIELELGEQTRKFLDGLTRPPIPETSIGQKLDALLTAINNLDRKVNEFMATQEERLQAISTKIDEVLSDLATLKANNPQIEDEIAAIEAKLSIAQPPIDGGGTPPGT